ncbi:MAG: hypothetical protein PX634_25975, partial [Microcystis sp. M53600_WE12]|nr:hypothetical protein [Microcystis sp. M53600_WE12]
FPIYPATIHRTSWKNQKLLLGLGVRIRSSGFGRQDSVVRRLFLFRVCCSQEVYTKSCLKGIGEQRSAGAGRNNP